jgi:phospholipid/cholesterol/gamma-HCH transport system substrate-binding protein
MENRAYALAAGLFTLLLGIGVVASAMWFSGNTVETDEYLLVSNYPVSGLNPQAPVRYRGVTVGKVIDISFDRQKIRGADAQAEGPVAILVRIEVETGTPLTEGSYAKLGSQGVTGLSYVMLDDDGKKPALLASQAGEPPRIPVRPAFVDTLTASGEEMIANINKVAQRVNDLLSDENQKQMVGTLRSLDHASGKLASAATAMEPTIKALPGVIADTGIALKRADTLLANLNGRLESFERAAKSAEQLGNSGSALTDVMLTETVPRLNVLLEDVQRSSRGLERLLNEINEQPQSLVFGRSTTPPGPGEPGFGAPRGQK